MSRLLSIKRVAERLDVSEKTIRRWIDAGEFPPPTHILPGQTQRWAMTVVEGWMILRAAGQGGFSGTPVKAKTAGTTVDNGGQGGTSDEPERVRPKTRI